MDAHVQALVSAGDISGAIRELSALIEAAPDAGLYYDRGRLRWKCDDRAGAISDYCAAVELDPASPAAAALDMARQVMDFYHRDLYNP